MREDFRNEIVCYCCCKNKWTLCGLGLLLKQKPLQEPAWEHIVRTGPLTGKEMPCLLLATWAVHSLEENLCLCPGRQRSVPRCSKCSVWKKRIFCCVPQLIYDVLTLTRKSEKCVTSHCGPTSAKPGLQIASCFPDTVISSVSEYCKDIIKPLLALDKGNRVWNN
jgi:hypothetical protein